MIEPDGLDGVGCADGMPDGRVTGVIKCGQIEETHYATVLESPHKPDERHNPLTGSRQEGRKGTWSRKMQELDHCSQGLPVSRIERILRAQMSAIRPGA